jgi:hypothetical protein
VCIGENWNSGLVVICEIGTMVWRLFAIHKVSISITAGIASANTDRKSYKQAASWCTVQPTGSARMVWR